VGGHGGKREKKASTREMPVHKDAKGSMEACIVEAKVKSEL